jgi:hypothetical protein
VSAQSNGAGVGVLVAVRVGVLVGGLVGVQVGVLVAVIVGIRVCVFVGVQLGVLVSVCVGVHVGVMVEVLVGVRVGVMERIRVSTGTENTCGVSNAGGVVSAPITINAPNSPLMDRDPLGAQPCCPSKLIKSQPASALIPKAKKHAPGSRLPVTSLSSSGPACNSIVSAALTHPAQ